MELQYSQTLCQALSHPRKFYNLMELHYSQTRQRNRICDVSFYNLMELHYSQTAGRGLSAFARFTTLWNYTILKPVCLWV